MSDSAQEWSAVAEAWDSRVADIDDHTAAVTAALIERLAVAPGDRLLELAAGPGSLGATWCAAVGPTGAVVLSDIAPGMVDAAGRRNAHLDNVTVTVLDASAIDLPSASFDVVTCRMGLMFTPDPATAFTELRRVLVPRGRMGVLTWAGPEHNPWMTCVGMAAMLHGLVAGGPPVAPGGIFSLADPAQLEALAEGAGFTDVVVEQIPVTFRAPDVDAHVDRVSSLAGPLARSLAAAGPDQQAAVRRTAAELAAAYVTDDGVALPGLTLLVTGRA